MYNKNFKVGDIVKTTKEHDGSLLSPVACARVIHTFRQSGVEGVICSLSVFKKNTGIKKVIDYISRGLGEVIYTTSINEYWLEKICNGRDREREMFLSNFKKHIVCLVKGFKSGVNVVTKKQIILRLNNRDCPFGGMSLSKFSYYDSNSSYYIHNKYDSELIREMKKIVMQIKWK